MFQLWHKIIEIITINPKFICEYLRITYEEKMREVLLPDGCVGADQVITLEELHNNRDLHLSAQAMYAVVRDQFLNK